MNYQGERNVAGAVGNLGQLAGNPFGPQFQIPQRGIRGMTPAQIQELKDWDPSSADEIERIYRNIQPGGPQLPMAMSSSQGFPPMGNAGFLATIPQGPHTPLPTPGWNPGMIKPPGDPNYRPAPQMERIGPTGERTPWQAAGFQNKFVS